MHLKIGRFDVYSISDGTFVLDGGSMFGMIPKVIWSQQVQSDASNMTLWGMHCLLVVDGARKILIETGMGTKLSPKLQKIYSHGNDDLFLKNLKTAGFSISDIDMVIPTHLHIDHAGGFTENGETGPRPRFPKAKYLLQRKEYEAAVHPNRLSRGSYLSENFTPVVEYGQQEWLDGDSEPVKGIHISMTGAHTHGHQVIRIESEGQTLFCPGDIIPSRWHVRQTFLTAYDLCPVDVMDEKVKFLNQAMQEKWTLHWYHDPEIVFGKVGMDGENFIPKTASL